MLSLRVFRVQGATYYNEHRTGVQAYRSGTLPSQPPLGKTVFSQTQDYALRAVTWIAQQTQDKPYGNVQIASGAQVAPSYMAKVLQQLTEAGILGSRRGVGGGFHLLRDIDQLTVLEVISAVEPIQRITHCPLGLKTHSDCRCPMHARLDEALELVERALRNSTIRDVLYEKGRPPPLVDTPTPRRRK